MPPPFATMGFLHACSRTTTDLSETVSQKDTLDESANSQSMEEDPAAATYPAPTPLPTTSATEDDSQHTKRSTRRNKSSAAFHKRAFILALLVVLFVAGTAISVWMMLSLTSSQQSSTNNDTNSKQPTPHDKDNNNGHAAADDDASVSQAQPDIFGEDANTSTAATTHGESSSTPSQSAAPKTTFLPSHASVILTSRQYSGQPSYSYVRVPSYQASLPKSSLTPSSSFPTTAAEPPSSHPPTQAPSVAPSTGSPSESPIASPSESPTSFPSETHLQTTTLFVIGDVPYDNQQAMELGIQMDNIPETADFVVHVGDIRSARNGNRCRVQQYEDVSDLLQRSAVPVFIVPGDNEWNDCPNIAQGWEYWEQTFMGFESRFWDTDQFGDILHMTDHPETFAFVYKRSLFVGLNIVGGFVHNAPEWQTRHAEQVEWLKSLMLQHRLPTVVFAHANPTDDHVGFFGPLRNFVRDELQNSIPLLYVNGDQHQWEFNPVFMNQPSWQRIMVTGGTAEPPLLVEVNSGPSIQLPTEAFSFDRQL